MMYVLIRTDEKTYVTPNGGSTNDISQALRLGKTLAQGLERSFANLMIAAVIEPKPENNGISAVAKELDGFKQYVADNFARKGHMHP